MGKVCFSQSTSTKHQHFLFQCWCILVTHLKEINLKNKNKVWGSDRPLHLHGLLLPSLCGFQWNVMLVLVQPALFLWNCRKTFGEALTCYLEFHVNAHFFFPPGFNRDDDTLMMRLVCRLCVPTVIFQKHSCARDELHTHSHSHWVSSESCQVFQSS